MARSPRLAHLPPAACYLLPSRPPVRWRPMAEVVSSRLNRFSEEVLAFKVRRGAAGRLGLGI